MSNGKYIFTDAAVVTSAEVLPHTAVIIEGGVIHGLVEGDYSVRDAEWERIDCSGKYLMPGFVDVHTHGGAGLDFQDESPEVPGRLSDYYYSHGVTTLLATLSPLPHDLLVGAVGRLARFCRDHRRNSNIAGIHLEGPYINRSMSGGNKKEYIEEPDPGRWREVYEAGEGFIRMITVAPELKGIDHIIEDAAKRGIVVALGHSTADAVAVGKAIELGARQVTHIFNAMKGLRHREPNLLSAALLSDRLDAQIIADGTHVHPDFVGLALKLKTADHLMLITDSMRAAGLADGRYDSAGNTVKVENGVSRMPDGTLAGSTLAFERGLKLTASLGEVGLPVLSRIASLTAARSLGLDAKIGSIEAGKNADIVVLDSDFKVELTMKSGGIEYAAVS